MFQRTKTRWSHISRIYCKICRALFSKGVPSHHKNFASALFIYPLWCIWLHSLLALQSEIFTWPCVLKSNVFGLTGEIAYSFGVKAPSRSSKTIISVRGSMCRRLHHGFLLLGFSAWPLQVKQGSLWWTHMVDAGVAALHIELLVPWWWIRIPTFPEPVLPDWNLQSHCITTPFSARLKTFCFRF